MSERLRAWLEKEATFDVQAVLVEGLSQASPAGLGEKLRLFRGLLLDHFREEEGDDGLFAEMARVAPETRDALDRLEAEHGEILALMQALGEALEDRGKSQAQLLAMRDELIARLQAHQQTEHGLLEQVLGLS